MGRATNEHAQVFCAGGRRSPQVFTLCGGRSDGTWTNSVSRHSPSWPLHKAAPTSRRPGAHSVRRLCGSSSGQHCWSLRRCVEIAEILDFPAECEEELAGILIVEAVQERREGEVKSTERLLDSERLVSVLSPPARGVALSQCSTYSTSHFCPKRETGGPSASSKQTQQRRCSEQGAVAR
jgi:hypothetical protein